MIYIETSAALAHFFVEGERPPEWVWLENLISSRLLEYEMRCRLNSRKMPEPIHRAVGEMLDTIEMVELSSFALKRALAPFPVPVRTLDAIHLSTVEFLRSEKCDVSILTYDHRIIEAAKRMKIPITSSRSRSR